MSKIVTLQEVQVILLVGFSRFCYHSRGHVYIDYCYQSGILGDPSNNSNPGGFMGENNEEHRGRAYPSEYISDGTINITNLYINSSDLHNYGCINLDYFKEILTILL